MIRRPTLSKPFGRHIDRVARVVSEFNERHPLPFRDTENGKAGVQGCVIVGKADPHEWTFCEFLDRWENIDYQQKSWWKLNKEGEIIGFESESEGRKMFLRIAEIVISFHERKTFSGNLVHKIRILPDLNVTHKSSPEEGKQAFENGGQKSDIRHFRWMVAAVVKKAFPSDYHSKISSSFRLFFSEIFTLKEGLKYFVSQLYHPIFFNSSDRCNLIRMMRDLYNLNRRVFKLHFELESYGFSSWWERISDGGAFLSVLDHNGNFNSLYKGSNGFALPLYIRNVHEHFSRGCYHKDIDLEIDNLFPGVSAAIIDSAIRNLHCYWHLFGSTTTTTTLPYLQRTSPYGWCFPYYRFRN